MIGRKSPKPKNLWYGIFNGHRHVYYLYCYAHTEKQARILFCKQIAKKQGVQDWMALQYFKEGGENYQIKLEMEITEDDQTKN